MKTYSNQKYLKMPNNINGDLFKSLFYFILLFCLSFNIYSQQKNKQPQIIKVGIYHNPPLEDYVDGKAIGLYPTLLNAIAKKNNWKIKYIFGSWNEVYKKLLNNKLDLLPNIVYLTERDSLVDYNKKTVLVIWSKLYLSQNANIHNFYELKNKKIGILKGGAHGVKFKKMMSKFKIELTYVEFMDYESIAKAIDKNEISGGVFNNFVGFDLSKKYSFNKNEFILDPNVLLFATKKGKNKELLSSIDTQLEIWNENPNSLYFKAINTWITNYGNETLIFKYLKWFLLIILGISLVVISWVKTIRNSRKKAIINYKDSIKKLTSKEEEKQKIQSKLHATEDYLQTIFDSTSDALFIHDGVTSEILDVNEQMCKMFGYKKEKVLHKTMNVFSSGNLNYTEKDAKDWILRAKKDGPQQFQWQARRKDGTIFWTEVNLKFISLNGEHKCIATVRNIEEQKEAENKQKKSTRLFDTLSQISFAVATISDKKNLLQKICDITTETGHYKLAWIGFIDTQNKLIKPLVFSGKNAKTLLSDFKISLTDEKLSKGPTRRALSEKKSIIINNVLTDASYKPWRKKAKELGYKSFISLPIFHHDKVIGSLNIDTDQYSFFDTSEVTLLEKITLNISIALEKFEQKENRIKVENKLKESYQIINRSPAVAFLWKKETGWQVEYVSENVQTLTGYSVEEFLSKKIDYFKIIHKNDVVRVAKEVDINGKNEECTSFHHKPYRIITKNDKIKWIDDYTFIRRNEKNEITHFEGLVIDITKRKKIEKNLFEKNQFFEKSLNETPLAFIYYDINSIIKMWNPAAETIFGYTAEEAIGKNIMDLIVPKDIEKEIIKVRDAIFNETGGEINQNENITKKGKFITCKWYNTEIKDENNKVIGLVSLVEDITELIKSEKILYKKEQQMSSIYNTVNDIIFYLAVEEDDQFRFISINKASAKNIGIAKEEIVGKLVNEIIPEPSLSLILKKYKQAINKKKMVKWEETTPYPTGIKIGEVSVSPIFDDNEVCTHIVGSVHDITERKEAEQEIKKLSTAISQSGNSVVITDKDGKIEYVNPKFTELTGYTLQDVLGENPKILKSGEHTKDFYQNLWETISNGNIWRGEVKNKTKNGQLFWEHNTISPITDKAGNITHFVAIKEDVTERKKILLKLQESEQSLQTAQDIAQMGSYDLNLSTQTGICSDKFFSLTEITPKTPLKFEEWRSVVHPDGIENNEKILKDSIKSKNYNNEYRIITKKTKTLKWIHGTGKIELDKNGKDLHFKGVIQDITDRKRAEQIQNVIFGIAKDITADYSLYQVLNLIQKGLGKLIDTSNFYIALYNESKNVLELPFMKDEKETFKTVPFEKSITSRVLKLNATLLIYKNGLLKLLKEGEIIASGTIPEVWLGVPLFINNKSIGVLAVQNYNNPNAFTEKDKELLEYVCTQLSQSIFRKQQEESLQLALQKATESDRLKTAFLHNISHEIRTPMNGIVGFSNLLENEDLSNEKQKKYIDIITKSSNRLLNTLNDLMDISKLETGQVKVDLSEMNIFEEMEHLEELFALEATNKGLKLKLDTPDFSKKLTIQTDKTKLNAVLTNLIKNAIKYSHQGTINFGCIEKQNHLEFYVKDEGIGISKDRQKAIFDRFVQADIEDKNVYEGAGLGLSISKSYIEMMNGKIWIDSEEEKGSTFYFTLPLVYKIKDKQKPKTIEAKEPKSILSKKINILIAEDDDYAYQYLTIVLEGVFKNLYRAKNGLEAIEICKNNPDLDVILMDVKMPVMSGYEATKTIREFNKNIVIIAQTAYALMGDKELAKKAGCNEYISKPIKRTKLIKLLETYFKN